MKRLTHEKEMDLMLPVSNMKNIKNFSKILGDFYYNSSTNERILKNLSPLSKPFPDNFLDRKFELNSQFRAFYRLETNDENDPAYLTYLRFLYDNCLHMKSWYVTYKELGGLPGHGIESLREPNEQEKEYFKKLEVAEEYNVVDYDIFCKGKVTIGKDKRKLFRFCLQNDLLDNSQVDRLNVLKTKGGLYICISRNPIDYLFVSTNQPFTSCLNLESTAEGCFWMGLGGLIVDVSRFLTFVTGGTTLRYVIKGQEFKHFKYESRSWGLIAKREELCIINAYPADKIGIKDRLREAGYKVMGHSDDFIQSLLNHEIPRHQDGSESTIYLDNVGISCRNSDKHENKRTWYYTDDGSTGSLSEFEFDGTFENVHCFDDLRYSMNTCDYCGERYDEESGYYCDNGSSICRYCYEEFHFTCRHCRNVFHTDESMNHDNNSYCEYCFERYYRICDGCETTHPKLESNCVNGEDWCQSCYDETFFQCCNCNDHRSLDECGPASYEEYCIECYNEQFAECDLCETVEETSVLINQGKNVLWCWSCVEKEGKGGE